MASRIRGLPRRSDRAPRDIIKASFGIFDFLDEDTWLSMLRDRNNTAHVYDGEAAKRLVGDIIERYIPEFVKMRGELLRRYGATISD